MKLERTFIRKGYINEPSIFLIFLQTTHDVDEELDNRSIIEMVYPHEDIESLGCWHESILA